VQALLGGLEEDEAGAGRVDAVSRT